MSDNTFTINIDNINVEDIMRQIRKKISESQIEEINMDMPGLSSNGDVEENLRIANMTYHIQPHLPITSHRKIIGKLIIFYKKVTRKLLKWYINPIAEQSENFNANVVRTLNSFNIREEKIIQHQEQQQRLISKYTDDVRKIESKLVEIEKINQNREAIDEIYARLKEIDAIYARLEQIKEVNDRIDQVAESEVRYENALSEIHKKVEAKNIVQQQQINQLMQINESLQQENSVLNARCRRIERHLKQQDIVVKEQEYVNKVEDKIDFDYFLFEEKYRGREEDIKNHLKVYLPCFEGKKNVLDIGCGRGEFLEILQENGVTAKGIDLDDEMVLICQEKGLDIEQMDAMEYLRGVEDNSLGGIIMTQVIEHMSPNYLIALIRLANQKLMRGAYLIAETINPQCLIVFTEAYFMDLSHTRMIHPLTAKFILESEGFHQIQLKYLSPVEEKMKVPVVENMPKEFNDSIQILNGLVYGYRDYAVIGRK